MMMAIPKRLSSCFVLSAALFMFSLPGICGGQQMAVPDK
jgi:hypothetical protein